MNNDYNGQNNPGFGEQQNPGFGESSNTQQNNTQQNGTGGQNGYSAPGMNGQGYYYQTPVDPNAVTPPKSGKDYGATAQTLGIIGIVASFICSCLPIVGLILGILAVVNGKRAADEAGQDKNAGTTGRICGIIAIVVSALVIAINIIVYVLVLTGAADGILDEYYKQLQSATGMAR